MFEERGMRKFVGVVGDIPSPAPQKPAPPQVYEPYPDNPTSAASMIVLAELPSPVLVAAVRSAVQTLDKDQPIDRIAPMSQLLADSIGQPRFYTLLLTVFAAIASALAAIGIYGVTAYAVAQRTREIGIRMALGAQLSDVLKLILSNGVKLTIIGVAIGLAGGVFVKRPPTRFFRGVSAPRPATFIF